MNTTSIPIPPLEPQRGSSLVGKAYWVMLQRVTLIAAAIDVGYILLFMGLLLAARVRLEEQRAALDELYLAAED